MKLKFVKIRDNHVIAVPESQFYGLLLLKKRYSGDQLKKMEPLFKYMFHDLEDHTAVVKDRQYFKMMDYSVKLNGPIRNFKKHIKTAVRATTSGDDSGGDSDDDDDDEDYEDSDEDSDLDEDYDNNVDFEPDDDEIYYLIKDKRGSKQKKGMVMDGDKYVIDYEEGISVTVTIASNFSCTAIMVFILVNALAVQLALGGMDEFWSRWTDEGGILPSSDAVSSIFGAPFDQLANPHQLIWKELPEHTNTLTEFKYRLESMKSSNDLLTGVTAEDIIEIYGGTLLSDDVELKQLVSKVVDDVLLESKPSEQKKMQKLLSAYNRDGTTIYDKGKLMDYTKAYVRWQPYDLLYGGVAFLIHCMDYEDVEWVFVYLVNLVNQGFENACAILLANLPEDIVNDSGALRLFLGKYRGVFISDEMITFTVENVKSLYTKGKRLMSSDTQKEMLNQARHLIKASFTNKKNKIRPAINRMIQALSLFVASSFSFSMILTNMIFRRIRRRYPKMIPSAGNVVKMLTFDAVGIVNMGLLMGLSALEIGAMSGVFSGRLDYNDISGGMSSVRFYSLTSIQVVASLRLMNYFNLENAWIIKHALLIHDSIILGLNGPTNAKAMDNMSVIFAIMYFGEKGLELVSYLGDKGLNLVSMRSNTVAKIYTKLKGLTLEDVRRRFDADIDELGDRMLTGSWVGSGALLKRMMTNSQAALLIKSHHLNYI